MHAQSCPTLRDPVDCTSPGLSVHGDSPGKNTGVGCHAVLQEIFPTQESNPGLLHCRRSLSHLSHQGSPGILEWVAISFSMRSSLPRDWTHISCVSCIGQQGLYHYCLLGSPMLELVCHIWQEDEGISIPLFSLWNLCLGWEGGVSDHDQWESVEGGELSCGEETAVMDSMGLWSVQWAWLCDIQEPKERDPALSCSEEVQPHSSLGGALPRKDCPLFWIEFKKSCF